MPNYVGPSECPFCDYDGPSEVLHEYTSMAVISVKTRGVYVIEPKDPVVDGHRLVIPRVHVRDAVEDPDVTAQVMGCAAIEILRAGLGPCNIITSIGRLATQTVMHLHVHIIPRAEGDGIMLPWSKETGFEEPRITDVSQDDWDFAGIVGEVDEGGEDEDQVR